MGHLLELLYKGRTIAKREGARANISWSPDKKVLQLDRIGSFRITDFRIMIWITIQDCQTKLHELMFG